MTRINAIFHSVTGHTAKLAQAIAEGVESLGGCTFSRVPGTRPSADERAIARAQGRALAETARAWKERRRD